jgi:hypothetical protein
MIPNAFLDKTEEPSSAEVTKAFDASAEIWKQLVDWLTSTLSPRRIFPVALFLGDRAVKAAALKQSPQVHAQK